MNTTNPSNDEFAAEQEELVAYLDREVTDAQREAIEARLASDPAYRERLSRLEQTWQMLDGLPKTQSDEAFTKTTIAMVALDSQRPSSAVANEAADDGPVQPQPGVPRWARWAAAAIIGFVLVSIPLQRARRNQLRDYPVIHNLDLYHYADSVEFLEMLAQSDLFADEGFEGIDE